MKYFVILSCVLALSACKYVPPKVDESLYTITEEDDLPDRLGYCDKPKPEGAGIYYERNEKGKCVAKVAPSK